MKLPWSSSMPDTPAENSDSGLQKNDPTLNFEGKKYDLNSLPKEIKELIKGMQVADAQLRMQEDSLKILALGRQSLAVQLKSKLEVIKPISE